MVVSGERHTLYGLECRSASLWSEAMAKLSQLLFPLSFTHQTEAMVMVLDWQSLPSGPRTIQIQGKGVQGVVGITGRETYTGGARRSVSRIMLWIRIDYGSVITGIPLITALRYLIPLKSSTLGCRVGPRYSLISSRKREVTRGYRAK